MNHKDLKQSLDLEVEDILNSDFDILIKSVDVVPDRNDADITFPNTDSMVQRVKMIETCVLYIDIRKSTEMNLYHKPKTLAKLYSSFVRSMARGSEFYGGKVRNIIGDRLMVVFNKENCYLNSIKTAILLNSIAQYTIDKKFVHNEFKCGIGIDYGKMLVTKAGIIKYGHENENYKSLVWLGRPANIASKLTDLANKTHSEKIIEVATTGNANGNWSWHKESILEFVKNLEKDVFTKRMNHKHPDFQSFIISEDEQYTPTILITESVYNGLIKDHPSNSMVINKQWNEVKFLKVAGYSGKIYGADLHWPDYKNG
ncbi:adenylate/guanylate cyclase domain-containing protein [Paenibacillus sp. HWE-109]|uniref:adenylate/guanylate cyclase domain-containing protein n=1 Tax=Paenibacillus sp. HWE-109 TaxID=1306526 RepID=UPI001EDD75E0|nr:adenylate/guanylate cyclase domain-containing protein [Paenibacillus sp. HWE-109]UKS29989.1 adenylate/guanylate cyclase domain-containing protein [Paenibacillus sp. HWE-109]